MVHVVRGVVMLTGIAVLMPSAAIADGGTGSATLKGSVRFGGQCGPSSPENAPHYRAFDAIVRIRNEETGELTRVRSGDDGRFRRRLPPGDYLITPGRPRERVGYAVSKDRISVRLCGGTTRKVRLTYDNGCR
jgi:hypothetical protein